MNYTDQLHLIASTQLFGFGSIKTRALLESLESPSDIFTLSYKELEKRTGFNQSSLRKMERAKAVSWAEKVKNDNDKFGIESIFINDPRYPRRLKQCSDAPLMIYTKGNVDFNDSKFVAIVGTRNATDYGKRICNELIESFIGTNVVVVSGLAYGIDIAAHKSCLQHGVPTIGVLAHGLEMTYPRVHGTTAKQMIENGALITEFPPYTNPDRENFPMRNRIVAGMCDATIVVESKLKGGSLITADLANDYSRDVFAFPGSIFDENSLGCNQLIAGNKAHLLSGGEEFLTKMGWNLAINKPIQKSIFPVVTGDEKLIVDIIQEINPINIDVLALKLKMPISKLSVHLFQLEMSGIVKSIPGNKCQLA